MKSSLNGKKKKPKQHVHRTYPKMAICRCGHSGGAPFSSHEDGKLESGHGRCLECHCKKFTWKEYVNIS
jgi:CDGSH-type Zn-finger protein